MQTTPQPVCVVHDTIKDDKWSSYFSSVLLCQGGQEHAQLSRQPQRKAVFIGDGGGDEHGQTVTGELCPSSSR